MEASIVEKGLGLAAHVQHHYVPKFLLERWHSGPDDKLTAFRWAHGKLDAQRYKAKSVARLAHLYSLLHDDGRRDVTLERDFMGPAVDAPAAAVHRVLIEVNAQLDAPQQHAWARFVVSLLMRGPLMVERLRDLGRAELEEAFSESPTEYDRVRGDAPEASLLEFVQARKPALFENFGMQLMPSMLDQPKFLAPLLVRKIWVTRRFDAAKRDLLIGDRPVIQHGPVIGDYAFTMPLSSDVLFAVCSSPGIAQRLRYHPADQLISRLNAAAVQRSETFAFATSHRHDALVRKWLIPPGVDISARRTPAQTAARSVESLLGP